MSWTFKDLNSKDHLGNIIAGVTLTNRPTCFNKTSSSTHKVFRAKTLTWSEELGNWLWTILSECSYPYRNTLLPQLDEDLIYHLRRFFVSIDAYLEAPNPVMNPYEIISGSLLQGPSYATYLKRLRTKAFITTCRLDFIEAPEWYQDIPAIKIKDIGDIFNYQYLIHWKEDCTDYLFGDIPISNLTGIQRFKEVLDLLLPDDIKFPIIEPLEVLLDLKSSNVFEITEVLSKTQHFELKHKNLSFNSERSLCKRTVIQVAPEGARDTVINSIKDINTINLIEYQTQALLQNVFKENVVNRNMYIFESKYKKFQEKFRSFLCRDFTKEGITKPRELLTAMLEVLHKKYPNVPGFSYVKYFNNMEIYDPIKRVIINPVRGHGLGMANALTTLMQIVIIHMTLGDMDDEFISEVDFLTENDDIIIGFNNSTEMWSYWNKEEEILNSLSLIRNPKKSFYGHAGVFLERYFTKNVPSTIGQKDSYKLREVLMSLTAHNITQAKFMISSLTWLETDILDKYMEEILSFWGWEFFPEEIEYPATLGGWYNRSIFGIRLDLDNLEESDYNIKIYKAFQACKHNILPQWGCKSKTYSSVVSKLFPGLDLTDQDEDILDYLDIRDPSRKFERLKFNPVRNSSLWEKLFSLRQSTFKGNWDKQYNLFLEEFIEFYQDEEFYPLEHMVKKYVPTEELTGSFQDPWSFGNPKTSLISYLTGREFQHNLPNDWNWRNFSWKEFNFKRTSEQRKRLRRILNKSSIVGQLTDDSIVLPRYNQDFLEFTESFTNPIGMGKASMLYGYPNRVPILHEQYRNPNIKRRKTVYNKLLTRDEFILLSTYSENNRFRIAKGIRMNPNFLELLSSWEPPEPSSSSDSSNDESDDRPLDFDLKTIIRKKFNKLSDEELINIYWTYTQTKTIELNDSDAWMLMKVGVLDGMFSMTYKMQALSSGKVGTEPTEEEFKADMFSTQSITDRIYTLWKSIFKRLFPGEKGPGPPSDDEQDMGFNLDDTTDW